jgi:hypothetical protein
MPKETWRYYHSFKMKNQFVGAMLADQDLRKQSAAFDIPYDTAQKIWKKY